MELFVREIQASCEADLYQPLISWLSAQKKGQSHPPYIPTWDAMPLHKLLALAILWNEAGFLEEAGRLAYFLLPLESFPTLWCPEKEFNEERILQFFSRLKRVIPIPHQNPHIDLTLFETPSFSAALTLTGRASSMGVIRTEDAEIRAFGPQALPLTEQNRFGIQGKSLDGWTSCFALPEVWLHSKSTFGVEGKIDLRFVGLKPEEPLAFVFYVKAKSCSIGDEVLQPGSLRSFHGQEKRVQLGKTLIESSSLHKVQIIPLAGEGSFWDADFLISFELHFLDPQIIFTIYLL
jgi:hypothetical protein